jgi:histone acetyltransferase (RNA polymerase elongator complex component)
LDGETLCMLKEYGVKTVEVGVQSMIDLCRDTIKALGFRSGCSTHDRPSG